MEIHEDLRTIMEYAGLSYSCKISEVDEIEICLEELKTLSPIKYFTSLKILFLCNTQISVLDGLKNLVLLEELYLSENQIQVIENLETLKNLKKLNLSSNKIENLENLESLVSLEWLWINENNISVIEGISALQNLKEFSVAKNLLNSLSNSLTENASITTLNISGNPISSFTEIQKLSQMESLENLSLADPNFGDCTICALSNYSVFVIYILKKLKTLDLQIITNEHRSVSEATFLKKKLYYTMKIKTLKRSISSLIKSLSETTQEKVQENWDYILPALVRTKRIEREIDERIFSENPPAGELFTYTDTEIPNNPLNSVEKLEDQLNSLHSSIIQSIKEEYQKICRFNRIYNCVISKIQVWGNSMFKEIETEFEAGGNLRFEEGQPSDSWFRSCCELVNSRQGDGMKATVTRVSRIHNRLLRTRFEEKLDSLIDMNENSYKRNIDYLFYSGPDLSEIISEGFKTPAEYARLNQPSCIPLSYSLSTAETERVRKLDEDFEDVHEIYWPKGKVLLCKVYFGKGKGDLRVPYYGENMSPKEIWELYPFSQPNICWAVYRTFEYDIKQRVWFIFDNSLVLPEYLIEFEYSTEGFGTGSYRLDPGLEVLGKTLNAFYSEVIQKPVELEAQDIVPTRQLIRKVDEVNISKFIKGEYLNLLSCDLEDLFFLTENSKIKTLILSGNSISSVAPLAYLSSLEKLDLSFNLIESLDGLKCLSKLEELDLNNNCVSNLTELQNISKSVIKLNCFLNKIYLEPRYDEVILSLFPNLVILDWRNISKNTRQRNLENVEFLHPSIMEKLGVVNLGDVYWKLESVNLANLNLLTIRGLESCRLVKKLNLSFNLIKSISGIELLENLEDFDASHNFIINIECLPGKLKYLDICNNKLQDLPALSNLQFLNRLCVDSNYISKTSEVKNSNSIIELYISNNQISDIRDILSLKSLSYLAIFDCLHNPSIDPTRHRLHMLYHFPNLKVLNGTIVETTEILAARQEYGGALTEDLLEKRSTGIQTSDLRQLNLSSSKLRSIEAMFTSELLPRLLEINLSNNNFTNFSMFGFMPMLAKIDLSHNKIDCFQFHSKIQMPLPNVEILNLSHNSLTSLFGLPQIQLRSLRILNISYNSINRIDYIECLGNLRELDVSFNKLRIVDKKIELNNLKSVNFESNGLKNLNFLEGLLMIQAIRAQNNRITDIGDIEKIQGLPNLMELYLVPNPIERKAGYRAGIIKKFPGLVFLDGKEIGEDERAEQFDIKKQPYSGLQKITTRIASITLDAYFLKIHPRTAGTNKKN